MSERVNGYLYSLSTGCYSHYSEELLWHPEHIDPATFQAWCIEAAMATGQWKDNYFYGANVEAWLCEHKGFTAVKPLNCHLYDYSFSDQQCFVIDGLDKRITLRELRDRDA